MTANERARVPGAQNPTLQRASPRQFCSGRRPEPAVGPRAPPTGWACGRWKQPVAEKIYLFIAPSGGRLAAAWPASQSQLCFSTRISGRPSAGWLAGWLLGRQAAGCWLIPSGRRRLGGRRCGRASPIEGRRRATSGGTLVAPSSAERANKAAGARTKLGANHTWRPRSIARPARLISARRRSGCARKRLTCWPIRPACALGRIERARLSLADQIDHLAQWDSFPPGRH